MHELSIVLFTAAAAAQSPLTTTFANNGNGAVGGAVYYDLTSSVDITLTRIDLHFTAPAGTAGSIDVFTIGGGTWVGSSTNASLWSLTSSASVTAAGVGARSVGVLSPPIPMPAGTTLAVAIRANGLAHAYTIGTAPLPLVYSTIELTLSAGGASNVPFGPATFSPRLVNADHHYVPGSAGTVATNLTFGFGCPREFASFYENFTTAAAFDLFDSALTLAPYAGGYSVSGGGTYNPVGSLGTATALPLANNSQVPAGTLGLTVGSNGWIALGGGNSNSAMPNVATLLSNPATAFYCWHDFDPAAIGSGAVWYEESGTLAQVTFDGVYDFGGTSPAHANFVQFQIDTATSEVVIAWQTMSTLGNGFLVGYSPGGPNLDPGDSNLSDVRLGLAFVQTYPSDSTPLALGAASRPLLGTTWNLDVTEIPLPLGAVFAIYGLFDPNILDLGFLGMPNCQLRANLDLIEGPWLAVGSYTYSLALPPPSPNLLGAHLFTQAAVFDPGINPLGLITSNAVRGTLGNL